MVSPFPLKIWGRKLDFSGNLKALRMLSSLYTLDVESKDVLFILSLEAFTWWCAPCGADRATSLGSSSMDNHIRSITGTAAAQTPK